VRGAWVRTVHLAIGVAVVVAGVLQALLGIELLP
jgi:hypothetical protein